MAKYHSRIGVDYVSRLTKIMDECLISVSELARKANLADNTIRRAASGRVSLRVGTKRRILDAVNEIRQERGISKLTASDLFEDITPDDK